MNFQLIPLNLIQVNKNNDRHGPTSSENTAIDWLFEHHSSKMVKLAEDIAKSGRIFDAPLVKEESGKFIVFDGNRRVTCLKLIADPNKSPEPYRTNFLELAKLFPIDGNFKVFCQIETNQLEIDTALSRRHNGTDGGRGQLGWDPRAKANHAGRTGGTKQYPIAEAIEDFLSKHGFPDADKVGRSTVNRLLKTKKRQKQFGFDFDSQSGLTFEIPESDAFHLLSQVANDILEKKLTLSNLLRSAETDKYLESLKEFGLVDAKTTTGTSRAPSSGNTKKEKKRRDTLIPNYVEYDVKWQPRQGKVERLWNELRSTLFLTRHELAIPVTFRALIELVTTQLMSAKGISDKKKLGKNILASATWMKENGHLSLKEFEDLQRTVNDNKSLRALEALHRVVHSPSLSLSKNDKVALWDSFEPYILKCIENG